MNNYSVMVTFIGTSGPFILVVYKQFLAARQIIIRSAKVSACDR